VLLPLSWLKLTLVQMLKTMRLKLLVTVTHQGTCPVSADQTPLLYAACAVDSCREGVAGLHHTVDPEGTWTCPAALMGMHNAGVMSLEQQQQQQQQRGVTIDMQGQCLPPQRSWRTNDRLGVA